jgi:monofunctional biosynthetic peptidoglycan transglycosylase
MAAKDPAESTESEPKRRPRRRKTSRLRRILRRAAFVVVALVLLPYVILPFYISVNPPITTVMIWKLFGGVPMTRTWVDLDRISPNLVRAVLTSEDSRFCTHHGVDWIEMRKALDDTDGPPRGASTIDMQMVKNLFLWTGRSYIRKALELPLALHADFVLSKRRIMEIYLNIVEWDTGIYGAQAAARHYFGVDASALTPAQAARLAAVLPAPDRRDAGSPGPTTLRIAQRIARRVVRAGADASCVLG